MVDATVLIAGTVWPRWSYEVLNHALRGDFNLVLSPLVIEQARTNLRSKFPNYSGRFEFWLVVCPYGLVDDPGHNEVVANASLVRHIEDVPVALSAMTADVDCFVSDDKDFTEQSASTQELHRRLTIMRPVIFLREMMGWSSAELEKVRQRNWLSES